LSSLAILRRPLLPTLLLTKNDASQYSFNHFTSTYDFRLRQLVVEPPFSNVGGKFTMKLTSQNASNSASNTILSNIEEGNEIEVSIGKTNGTKEKVFLGTIEDIEITEPSKHFMDVTLSGPDWGSDILKNRVVNGSWVQDKIPDGSALDTTDNKVLIDQIIKDLLQKTGSYPVNDVTVEDQGVIVNSANIILPTIRLSSFICNFEYLDDKISEIDAIAGSTHYIDANRNFKMYQLLASSSIAPADFLLTDDYNDPVALGWNQDKVGLIGPKTKIKRTIENTKRRLFGLGGDQTELKQKQETDSSSDSLEVLYRGMKFQPSHRILDTVWVYVSKTGSPQISLDIDIIEDLNGEPLGTVLRSLSEEPERITASPRWIPFKINVDVNTTKPYWIVLLRNDGGDASNHFNWHHDAGSSSTNASSSDAQVWTVNTSSKGYMFRAYTASPVLTAIGDNISPFTGKAYRESVIRQPDITEVELMTHLIIGESKTLFKKKQIISMPIYAPNTLLTTGQKVRVRKQLSGFTLDSGTDGNGDFIIGNIKYMFDSTPDLATGTLWYDIEAARFVPWN